jgi:hypothetical protein
MIDYIQGLLELNKLIKMAHDALLKQDAEGARTCLARIRLIASETDEMICKQFPNLLK